MAPLEIRGRVFFEPAGRLVMQCAWIRGPRVPGKTGEDHIVKLGEQAGQHPFTVLVLTAGEKQNSPLCRDLCFQVPRERLDRGKVMGDIQ